MEFIGEFKVFASNGLPFPTVDSKRRKEIKRVPSRIRVKLKGQRIFGDKTNFKGSFFFLKASIVPVSPKVPFNGH